MSWADTLAAMHDGHLATWGRAVTFEPGDELPAFSTRPDGERLLGIFVDPHTEASVSSQVGVSTVRPTLGLRLDDLAAGLPREIARTDYVQVAEYGDPDGPRTRYGIGDKEPDGRGWVHLFLHEAAAAP